MAYKVFAGVNAALHVALERSVVEPAGEIWLEQHFRASRNVRRDSDDDSVWENVLDLHHVVNSFVMRSTTSRNVVVPLDNTTLTYKFLQMSASHFATEIWQEQNFLATKTFGADGDEVSFRLEARRSSPCPFPRSSGVLCRDPHRSGAVFL